MLLIFIGNRKAGKGKTVRVWPELEKALARIPCTYAITWTESKSQLEEAVRDALERKPNWLISLGGDGTIHSILQYFYKFQAMSPSTFFTAYPVGTGNDWARYWKIPNKIGPWLRMIEHGRPYDHDLGHIEYTDVDGSMQTAIFNNVAGMAYDAYVADFIESKKKKMAVGGIQYLWFIFRCLFGYKLQGSSLQWGDQRVSDRFYTINIGICPYSGGGLLLVPHARPDSGSLAVTAVRPINKLKVLLMTPHFYSGRLHLQPEALAFKTDEIYITPQLKNEIIKLEAEGEILGRLPARFKVLKKAIKIWAP